MKLARMLVVCAAVSIAPAALAQKWEIGGGAGWGFNTSRDVTAPGGSASAKIADGVAGGAWLDNTNLGHWGGEIRYDYQRGNLQLVSGATKTDFRAETHALHYDVLWHAAPAEARKRPFIAIGGGVKVYRGTGNEVLFQPLSNLAVLTRTKDLEGLVSVGAGIKWRIGSKLQLRVEVHDYLTPFPLKVITPNIGAKVGGWMQDIVPTVGISFVN